MRIFLLALVAITMAQATSACSAGDDEQPVNNEPAQSGIQKRGSKTLVAYFSGTNTTKAVADEIVRILGADQMRIVPAKPYASNPYDDQALIQQEAYNDLRPAVANLPSKEEIAAYDTLFVGSPIWWHQPAMVVCTFLENYDLSGKVVIPFFTYGATTYLNESMQKVYKVTPNSIHIPATLPEDLDPNDIQHPQDDDAGIPTAGRASNVGSWLRQIGVIGNNPTAVGRLSYQAQPLNETLYTLDGQKVATGSDRSSVAAGVYVLRQTTADGKTQSRKVFIR